MALEQALVVIRARPWRTLLTAGGIAAAAAMLGASITVSFSLATGFDRAAARAGMPDVIAHFDQRELAAVRKRIGALPNVAAVAYRLEERRVHVWAAGRPVISSGELEGVMPGRRGYAITAGSDLSGRPGEAVIERGLAQAWHLRPGDSIRFRTSTFPQRHGVARIVGIAVAPDNVAFPLASEPRIWMPYEVVRGFFAQSERRPVDEALIWVHNRALLNVTLEQARAASFGVGGLTFITRTGVRVLIDQAAGIVIALLVSFSLVAIAGAGAMLFASSRAEVQRRLEAFAVLRALGASRSRVTWTVALEAALVALPAAVAGVTAGWAISRAPAARLLDALDQLAPGWDLFAPLAGCVAAVVLVVVLAAAWPAWRAAGRQIAPMLRTAELGARPRGGFLGRGWGALGMRMMVSRPVRTLATAAVLAASGAVVLLMLALASLLDSLEHNPAAVGKRYQLTARGSAPGLAQIRALPGVGDAAQRFTVDVADAYQLGEQFQLVSYCGDRLRFEAPALEAGRRAVRPGEAEVGQGLATALGLRPGARLATQFPDGDQGVFRVVGVVNALENDGRVVYVQPGVPLCRFHGGQTVVQLAPGASRSRVAGELTRTGRPAQAVGGVTTNNAAFVGALVAVLRTVAGVDGLVCLYAVVQVLALMARERRTAVAVLRACGAGGGDVRRVFAGAALVVCGLAAPVAVVLEREVLGPAVAQLAASYAEVSLRATADQVALTLTGLVAVAAGAAWVVAHGAMHDPIVAGLRAE
jgi:FtsX-like permease family